MAFTGTGSNCRRCQIFVLSTGLETTPGVSRLIDLACRLDMPTVTLDEQIVKLDTLRWLEDAMAAAATLQERPRKILCGGFLEAQVSAIAHFLLMSGFDVVIVRDLVQAREPEHAGIHDQRLIQSGAVLTTMKQLIYEWIANEAEDDIRSALVHCLGDLG